MNSPDTPYFRRLGVFFDGVAVDLAFGEATFSLRDRKASVVTTLPPGEAEKAESVLWGFSRRPLLAGFKLALKLGVILVELLSSCK